MPNERVEVDLDRRLWVPKWGPLRPFTLSTPAPDRTMILGHVLGEFLPLEILKAEMRNTIVEILAPKILKEGIRNTIVEILPPRWVPPTVSLSFE